MAKVVISGIGGSFPSCENFEEFNEALCQKTNLITDLQAEEWTGNLNVPHHLGRDKNYMNFDFTFLSINYNLANTMDKITKSMIRHGYMAILDAGYSPADLRGGNINVFMQSTVSDDESRLLCGGLFSQTPLLLGLSRTMQANRVSAYFNFHGTSNAYQASYDNVFEALKIAYEELSKGRCDGCLVGASNLCLHPQASMEYDELGLLTKDPVNRPLDENANGYIRADSTVVFYLQRESDARRIYAEIVNVGSIYIGDRLGTFLAREEKYMVQLLEDTYRQCGVKPNDISYLETGSWANKVLDTQELNVIRKVFGEKRTDPLPIGSVVGNTGFTEACAGFVGMVKAILAFRNGFIAPTLHVDKPNAAIDEKLQIVTENTPVKDYVAVNALGLYGGFSHVILKKSTSEYAIEDNLPRLYMMATRNVSDFEVLFKKLNSVKKSKYLAATMCDVFRREIKGYMGRCFAIYNEHNMIVEQSKPYEGNKRPVWFLFSGMGSQWQAMGKDLMKFPIFAKAIAKCDAVLREHNVDIVNILTNEEDTTIYENILNSFVGIAAVQIGLVDMLHAMEIQPDGMIGHSVGELGCAYADGCLTAEQTIYAALVRGKASKEVELIPGMMAAVGLGYNTIKPVLPPDIEVACRNSSSSCTLSGPSESVHQFVNILAKRAVFAKVVNVSNIAYHSRYIKPAAPVLLKYLEQVITEPKPRSSKWISTSVQEENWNSDLAKYASPEYFTNNLLSTVYFEDSAHHIPKNAIVIEIAPHALLAPIVKKSLDLETVHIALTNRSKSVNNIQCLLEGFGNLYLNGCEPNVNAIYPDLKYPIPAEVPSITSFLTWDFSITTNAGLDLGNRKCWYKSFVLGVCSKPKYQHLLNYKIGNKFLIPPAGYISLILDLFVKLEPAAKSVAIENFRAYECDMDMFQRGNCDVSIAITRVGGSFAITAEDHEDVWCPIEKQSPQQLLATGEIKLVDTMTHNIPEWKTDNVEMIEFEDNLKNLRCSSRDHEYVKQVIKHLEGFSAEISSSRQTFDLLDACLKVVSIARSDEKKTMVPFCIQSMVFNVDTIREYKQGKSVRVFYDPVENELTSSAFVMKIIKTKEFLLDNRELSNSGPVSYLTFMKSAKLNDIDINFVGISSLESKDETIVDFSGTMSSGNRVMGIVSCVDSMIQFDRTLLWNVPSSWTLDQAVTVPIVYCMAYLCIVKEKPCWRDAFFKRTLIHCGDTPLGEACIAVALAKEKTVYTTVSSEQGRQILLARFPQLSSSHIFLNTSYDYFMEILLRFKHRGVHLVVNTMKDKTHFEFSWNLLAMNGEIIQIGIEETNTFGMYRFLNSQSVLSLDSSVVLNQDEATKKHMYQFINDGIKDGVIQPFAARIGVAGHSQSPSLKEKGYSYKVISLNTRDTSPQSKRDVHPDSPSVIRGSSDNALTKSPESHHLLVDAHLPLDHLEILHSEISKIETPTFVEQVSQSLKKDLAYNLLPVFFIPGLSQISLKKLIGKMMYPSFLGHIPAGWAVDDIVVHLYKSLKRVQQKGLYTLVAESWGGLYAIKLAEYIENKGERVNLILLEGSPYTLKNIVEENQNIFKSEISLAEYIVQKQDLQPTDVHTETRLTLSCKIIWDRVNHHKEMNIEHKLNCKCSIVSSDMFLTENNIKDLYKIFKSVSAFLPIQVLSPFQYSLSKDVVRFVNENVAHEWW